MSHFLDAAKVLLKLLPLFVELCDFLLGKYVECAVLGHSFDLLETLDPALDGLEVCEHAAQPSLVYIVHAAALSLSLDCVLCLLLGAYEEDGSALLSDLEYCSVSLVNLYDRLLKVDDVDPVSLCEDVGSHLGVPASCLMTEMYACFKQLFH